MKNKLILYGFTVKDFVLYLFILLMFVYIFLVFFETGDFGISLTIIYILFLFFELYRSFYKLELDGNLINIHYLFQKTKAFNVSELRDIKLGWTVYRLDFGDIIVGGTTSLWNMFQFKNFINYVNDQRIKMNMSTVPVKKPW